MLTYSSAAGKGCGGERQGVWVKEASEWEKGAGEHWRMSASDPAGGLKCESK